MFIGSSKGEITQRLLIGTEFYRDGVSYGCTGK